MELKLLWEGRAVVILVIMEIHTDFLGLFQTPDMMTQRNQKKKCSETDIVSKVEHK